MRFPLGPTWTRDEGVWEEPPFFHSQCDVWKGEERGRLPKRRPVKDVSEGGKKWVSTEGSQLFPQLLITSFPPRCSKYIIHNNGEVTCNLVITPGHMLNFKYHFKCPCALVFVLCCEFLLSCSIHTLILPCMCVCWLLSFFKAPSFFFLSAVHLSSVAGPKPIFARSRWQRGGDCQGGGPCLLGKRRYRDFHKAVAALWGQISRSCCAVWLLWVSRMCVCVWCKTDSRSTF